MSDEEKKAIEYWKHYMSILHWNTQLASEHYMKLLLDLIEKQQKQIQDLKQINEEHRKLNGQLREENRELKKEIQNIIDFIED